MKKRTRRVASRQVTNSPIRLVDRPLTYAPSGGTVLGRGDALRRKMLEESALLACMGSPIAAQYLRDAAEALSIASFERMAQ